MTEKQFRSVIRHYNNGRSVRAIEKLTGVLADHVRHVLRDAGYLLVGNDAGERSQTKNYATQQGVKPATAHPRVINDLFRRWPVVMP